MSIKKKSFSLKQIILLQIIFIFLGILSTFILCRSFFHEKFITQAKDQLEYDLYSVRSLSEISNIKYTQLCGTLSYKKDFRVTIINKDGHVLCDSTIKNVTKVEDHSNRPEVLLAENGSFGSSVRFSETLSKNMLYGAVIVNKGKDKEKFYIRLAIPLDKFDKAKNDIIKSIIMILIPIFIFLSMLTIKVSGIHKIIERQKADKLKEEFLSNISHEVRTPLTAIKGYSQVLKTQQNILTDSMVNCVDKIESNSERLSHLFRDILELSTLERKKELFYELINVSELIFETIDSVQQSYLNKNIIVKTELMAEELEADSKAIEQVITNLIDNAYKYTPKGGNITIRTYCLDSDFILSVEDNGLGIPESDLNKIFERFYRVDESRSRDMGGTGLGLAIVKHITYNHNGSIQVISDGKNGSKFLVKMPKYRS